MSAVQRVGVIGDVHAEHELLEAVLRHLQALSVDSILCTGDVVDGLGSVSRCVELLCAAGVITIRGNHDRWFLAGEMRSLPDATLSDSVADSVSRFLANLPTTERLGTSCGPLLLCHGLAENDMARLTPDDFGYALETNDELQLLLRDRGVRFVVAGHTHRPMVRHFPNLTVINAGTLVRNQQPRFLVLDFERRIVEMHILAEDGRLRAQEDLVLVE